MSNDKLAALIFAPTRMIAFGSWAMCLLAIGVLIWGCFDRHYVMIVPSFYTAIISSLLGLAAVRVLYDAGRETSVEKAGRRARDLLRQ